MSTVDQLKNLIHSRFGVALDTIDADAPFVSYDLDSLTVAELMFAIDDEFHVIVPDEAANSIKTLSELAALLDSLLAKKSPS